MIVPSKTFITTPYGVPLLMVNNSIGSTPNLNDLHMNLLPFDAPIVHDQWTTPLNSTSDTLPYDNILHSNEFPTHSGMPSLLEPSISPPPLQPSISQDDYIMYYFQDVRKLQFPFAGSSLGNLLYSVSASLLAVVGRASRPIDWRFETFMRLTLHQFLALAVDRHQILMSEPQSAITYAICALSSLHSARLRISRGLELPNPHPERSIPKYFYDQAAMQLMTRKTMNGHYADQDALAALYLVGFSTLSGGSTNWQTMLDIACEWFAETGILEEQNPKLTFMNMSHISRLAARATMVSFFRCIIVRYFASGDSQMYPFPSGWT